MTTLTSTIRSFLPLDEQGIAVETLLRKVFLHARNATHKEVSLALAVLRSQEQILMPVESDVVRYNAESNSNLYTEKKKRLLAIVETPHTLVQLLNFLPKSAFYRKVHFTEKCILPKSKDFNMLMTSLMTPQFFCSEPASNGQRGTRGTCDGQCSCATGGQ